jgi:hypothetical protein
MTSLIEREIKQVLKYHGGRAGSDVIESILTKQGYSTWSIRESLDSLVKKGELRVIGPGAYEQVNK